MIVRATAKPKLQWGRNMIVAEGRPVRPQGEAKPASMGPQHDSCGRTLIVADLGGIDTGFNGAAT